MSCEKFLKKTLSSFKKKLHANMSCGKMPYEIKLIFPPKQTIIFHKYLHYPFIYYSYSVYFTPPSQKEIAHLRDYMRQHSLDPDSPKLGFPLDYRRRYTIAVDFDKADTVRVNDRVNSGKKESTPLAPLIIIHIYVHRFSIVKFCIVFSIMCMFTVKKAFGSKISVQCSHAWTDKIF